MSFDVYTVRNDKFERFHMLRLLIAVTLVVTALLGCGGGGGSSAGKDFTVTVSGY